MFSYKNQHRTYQFLLSLIKERRLVFDTRTPNVPESVPETPGKPPETREKDVQQVTQDVDGQINGAAAKVEGFPEELKKQLHDNIAQYCRTTYDLQVQQEGVIQWRESVMAKVKEILEGLVGGAEKAKDEAEGKNEKLKSLEEEMKDLPTNLEEVSESGLALHEANLNTPDGLQTELIHYEERARRLGEQQTVLGNSFKEATDVQQAFQKEMTSGWGNVAGGAAVLGTTAGIAAATSWVPGLNLVTLGVVGAVVAGGAIVKAAERAREVKRAQMANAALQTFKGGFNEQKQAFVQLVRGMHVDGDRLHNAAPTLRSQIEENRAKGADDVLQAGVRVSEERAKALERQKDLIDFRDILGQKRTALGTQYNTWRDNLIDAEDTGRYLHVRREDCVANLNNINQAIAEMENRGADKEEKYKPHYARLCNMRHRLVRGNDALSVGATTTVQFKEAGEVMQEQVGTELEKLDFNMVAVNESNSALDMVMGDLDQQIFEIDQTYQLIDATALEHQETLNTVEPGILGGVSEIAVSNIQSLGSIQMQWKTLEPMTVEAPSYFASVGNMLAAPVNLVFKEWIGHGLSTLGKAIPIPGVSHAIRFVGGVSEGIGDIGGALAQLPARLVGALAGEKEGIETAQGIGNLFAFGLTEGSREAWGGMAKGIIAYEDWGKGSDAEAAGKAATNIALFLIPGVGQGMSAGRVAALAGKGFATRTIARAQGFVMGNIEAYASIPGALGRGAGRLLKRPFIGRQAALANNAARLGNAASTAEASLKGIQIGGQSIDDIASTAGRNLDDLGRMSPQELADLCGLDKSATLGDIRNVVRAQHIAGQRLSLMNRAAQTEEALQAAKAQQAAAETKTAAPAEGGGVKPAGTPEGPGVRGAEKAAVSSETLDTAQLVSDTKAAVADVRRLGADMRALENHGLLTEQHPALKAWLDGNGSVKLSEIRVEITRCDQFMANASPADKLKNLGTVVKYREALQSLATRGRALADGRKALIQKLPFKEGQRVRVVKANGEVVARGKFHVEPDGRVRVEIIDKSGQRSFVSMDPKYAPERLRNFQSIPEAPPGTAAAAPAEAGAKGAAFRAGRGIRNIGINVYNRLGLPRMMGRMFRRGKGPTAALRSGPTTAEVSLEGKVRAKITKAYGGKPGGSEFTTEFLTDRAQLTSAELTAAREAGILVKGEHHWVLAERQSASSLLKPSPPLPTQWPRAVPTGPGFVGRLVGGARQKIGNTVGQIRNVVRDGLGRAGQGIRNGAQRVRNGVRSIWERGGQVERGTVESLRINMGSQGRAMNIGEIEQTAATCNQAAARGLAGDIETWFSRAGGEIDSIPLRARMQQAYETATIRSHGFESGDIVYQVGKGQKMRIEGLDAQGRILVSDARGGVKPTARFEGTRPYHPDKLTKTPPELARAAARPAEAPRVTPPTAEGAPSTAPRPTPSGEVARRASEIQVRELAASGTEFGENALSVLNRKQLRAYRNGLQDRLPNAASLDETEHIQSLMRQTEEIAGRNRWNLS